MRFDWRFRVEVSRGPRRHPRQRDGAIQLATLVATITSAVAAIVTALRS